MRVEIATQAPADAEADLTVIGSFDGDQLPEWLREAPGAADVRPAFKELTMLRPGRPERLLVVGLGKREELDAERLRVAAALAERQGRRYAARSIAWSVPGGEDPILASALVEGTILASYRFDRFKSREPDDPEPSRLERLTLTVSEESGALRDAARVSQVASEAANRARELANLPSNVVTPSYLADRARQLSVQHEAISTSVLGREEIAASGMGGLVAVSAGSAEDPQLIAMRYSGGDGAGGALGLVGKAVTFDTGGISIKPAGKMHEMKMDMSGGAAVLEALAAMAELSLPIDVVAVVPATENMPSGTATKPGDIITQLNGKTVEVLNTDAEGRLILADALTYCVREMGATRLVDLATLTGAVTTALGSTYAALISNDDAWAEQVGRACERSGELAWRLPLHPEYKELTKGSDADLTNASSQRKASTIYAASFLEEFVDATPWVHLDIAGTAWDVGREYVGKGPTGMGVRLLVELARDLVAS
jgi:leucyl aminopeptidase